MKLLCLLLPFWFPIKPTGTIESVRPTKAFFFSEPYTIYKNKEEKYIVHSDICPHQGASLSTGKITKDDFHLQCPYHGFEFENGKFCKIPNPSDPCVKKFDSKRQHLPLLESKLEQDFLFVRTKLKNRTLDESVFFPPEEYNSSFRGVSGTVRIPTNFMLICENLLDMLHISYVHQFGSTQTPLPHTTNFTWLSPIHGQSTFFYSPSNTTISRQVGKVKEVKVENEFHMPTNTVTRVFAGSTIKTVFTRTIPISENESILYWKIYRNFWLFPLGDFLIRYLMNQTVKEDISILKRVYPNHRNGSISTKFDKTIHEFRKLYKKYHIF